MNKNRFFTFRIYNLGGEKKKETPIGIIPEKVTLLREVEETVHW